VSVSIILAETRLTAGSRSIADVWANSCGRKPGVLAHQCKRAAEAALPAANLVPLLSRFITVRMIVTNIRLRVIDQARIFGH
jgi:hypothetical protein